MGRNRNSLVAALMAGAAMLTAGQAAAQARTEITWWHAMSGRLGEIIETLVADFNASQDQYTLVAVNKGNYDETFNAMIAAYRVGEQPTMVQVPERGFMTMLDSGAIVPVNGLLKEQGYAVDWNDFIAPVASFYIVDGEPITMPFNSSTPITWYNADDFHAAGFDGPADTWAELETQLYAIKEQGISDCAMSLPGDYFWSMIENYSAINDQPFATQANGFGGLDTEFVYNTTSVVGQVERMKRWLDDGVLQIAGQGIHPEQLYINGTCSTIMASTAAHASVEAGAEFDWSAAFLPHEEGVEPLNSTIGGASIWVMQGQSDEQYAGAAAFLAFLAKPETQLWWHQQTGYVPVTNAAFELAKAEGYYDAHPTRAIAVMQLTRGEPTENSRGFRFGNHFQSTQALRDEMEFVWTGEKTPQEALDAAVERGNAILRDYESLHQNGN